MQKSNMPPQNLLDISTFKTSKAMLALARQLSALNCADGFETAEKLVVSEDWLPALVHHVSDYIFVKDRYSRFVMGNDRVVTDNGFGNISNLIGKTDWELHPADIAKEFYTEEQSLMEKGEPVVNQEQLVILPGEVKRWFSTSKYPVKDENGTVVGLIGSSRDITRRKQAELLLHGQNKVLQEIASGVPLNKVLETLVLFVEEQLEGIRGSVMLTDDAGEHLVRSVAPKLPKEYLNEIDGIPVGARVGSCGTAVFTRQNVFVDDIFQSDLWADYLDIMKNFDMRSCWSIPFFSANGGILGTFGLYSDEVRSPTEHERKMAEEAAHLASIAVERDKAESRIRYLADHDVLTGLPNRQGFKSKLEEEVRRSAETGAPIAVVFVDIDNFKCVNDSFGHAIGDQVLTIVAQRISKAHEFTYEAIRFGGDEFVLIIDGPTAHKPKLKIFLEKLRDEIVKTIGVGDLSFHVTCSIGAAVFPEDAETADEVLQNADSSMFEAKIRGRDNIVLHASNAARGKINKLALLEDMRSGIEAGQFFLEYQPQYDLISGRIVGVEALARWKHPEHGLLMPADFIGLAEDSGLILPLGRWVLKEACRQNKVWQNAGLTPITVGVNVSGRQFRDMKLITDVRHALEESALEAKYLELEMTESLLIQNAGQAVELVEVFRTIGVQLAIDDFGTGYSSLAALKDFPLTRLKMDRSFIRDLDHKESDRSIARAIISLGRELGLNVVAEGVETAKQQAFLASCQCETVQGFHYSRPMKSDKFGKLLAMTLTQIDVKTPKTVSWQKA